MSDVTAENRKRYRTLIDTAQSRQELWIAKAEDRVLMLSNAEGETLMPVWPTEDTTRQVIAIRPDLASFRPVRWPLDEWLNLDTPVLMEEGVLVAAYPNERYECLRVPAVGFARDLTAGPKLQATDISRLRRKLKARRNDNGQG